VVIRLRLAVPALLALVSGVVVADIRLEAEPAWSGYALAGEVSALRVTVVTPGAAAIEARQSSDGFDFRHRWDTAPGLPRTVDVPVLTRPGDTDLRLSVDGRPVAPLAWSPRWLEGVRLVATTVPVSRTERDRLRYLHLAPHRLPAVTEAYRTVAVTVVGDEAARQLAPRQQQALLGHAARCGRVLLVGRAEALWQALRAVAGCGGGGLARIAADAPLHRAVTALLERPLAVPDAGRVTAELETMTAPPLQRMGLFLAGYGLLLMAAAWRLPAWAPVGVSLAATLLAVAAWWGGAPEVRWVTAPPETTAVVPATWLAIAGTRRGAVEMTLPRSLGLPASWGGLPGATLTLDHDAPDAMVFAAPVALLATGWLAFGGITPSEASP